MFGLGPAHTAYNAGENTIGLSNVGTLTQQWSAVIDNENNLVYGTSSPAVASGVVYVGSPNHNLYAFDAGGATNCSGTPKSCNPMWSASTGGAISSSPAVNGGLVLVGSGDGKLYAFDAAGNSGCSGTPKTCSPLWTTLTAGTLASPSIANNTAYVGSADGKLYAFDATGTTGCSGTPKLCAPLWTANTGAPIYGSPGVANGQVYVPSSATNGLQVFDAAGQTNCSGTPKTCSPLWTSAGGGAVESSSIANGNVYVTGGRGLEVFDAAGITNCSGSPRTCSPLWTGNVVTLSGSPAVAASSVYLGAFAFDATGNTGCTGSPKTCAWLWDGFEVPTYGSPAVANGVVYMTLGGSPSGLSAFDAAGVQNCSGTPKTCLPLWTANPGAIDSQPVIANGKVYATATVNISRPPFPPNTTVTLYQWGLP
jgi:outer membrane protein assembly factor BamB